MIVAGHQPNFLPYPGFFQKMSKSDIFVLGDTLQFTNKEWQNRNRIVLNNRIEYMTVPIKRRFPVQIKEVLISDSDWYAKLLRKLIIFYGRSYLINELEEIFSQYRFRLIDLNIALINWVRIKLKIKTKMVYLSDLDIDLNFTASERIVRILKELKSDQYLAGKGSKVYLDEKIFQENGIDIIWNEWEPQTERDMLSVLQKFLDGKFYI